jgi:hypothetical protein
VSIYVDNTAVSTSVDTREAGPEADYEALTGTG